MRLTHSLVQVALALSEDVWGRHWGYDLSRRARVTSGVLYPILDRMLTARWLEDGWEDPAEISGRRPRRRYYTLTAAGRLAVGGVVADAATDPRFKFVPGIAIRGAV